VVGWVGPPGVKAYIESRGLLMISDEAAVGAIIDAVLAANAKQLEVGAWAHSCGVDSPCVNALHGVRGGGACAAVGALRRAGPAPPPQEYRSGKAKLQGFFEGCAPRLQRPLPAAKMICHRLRGCPGGCPGPCTEEVFAAQRPRASSSPGCVAASRRQVMKESKGRVNPGLMKQVLLKKLQGEA
jgi:hypothetical protein